MRKAFRHTGVLMMVAVVALGLLGAAYTLWYEKLTLQTTVSTGTLDADWSFHAWDGTGETFSATNAGGAGKPVVAIVTGTDVRPNGGASALLGTNGSGSGAALFTNQNFPTGKPQPSCNGVLAYPDADGGASSLSLTMSDLYPFAGCEFTINIENNGSVPFHLGITSLIAQVCDAQGNNCTTPAGGLPFTRGVVAPSVLGSLTSDYDQCLAFFNADWKNTLPLDQIKYPDGSPTNPVQIHNGTPLTCTFMLILDENWRTGSGGTYYDPTKWTTNQGMTFKVTTNYVAYQWNETPSLATPLP